MTNLNPLLKSTLELGRAQMKDEMVSAIINIEMDSETKINILETIGTISSNAREEDEERYK